VVVLGTGLTYRLSKNVQLDAGVNFGVTSAADRINPFVGLAVRF
jgi:long-subunit fatty acid transport protein